MENAIALLDYVWLAPFDIFCLELTTDYKLSSYKYW